MVKTEALFRLFSEKMRQEKLPPIVIDTFQHYFVLLVSGFTGSITKETIRPVEANDIANLDDLQKYEDTGKHAIKKAVIIKLNGGLGTSLGLSKAKSLVEIKDGYRFLDIIARQVLFTRRHHQTSMPIVFMNSFRTEADTLEALAAYPELPVRDLPLSFIQHKFPKILREGLKPASFPHNTELEWNPPGHGDIYTALVTSGMLERLLQLGIVYAFISNSDNLGAVFDHRILGYLAQNNIPFLMEVTDRTAKDKKGGHLARLKEGGLTLREIAQCPSDELEEFEDISLYRYFNTNSIWIDLKSLKEQLEKRNHVLLLDMIRNPKTLDPRDDTSPAVYQLETAMGAAISVFDGAEAIRVPRARFSPVKKSGDLVSVWSDNYVLTDQYTLIRNPKRKGPLPALELDNRYFKNIDDLKRCFPYGCPSLLNCVTWTVKGDFVFGRDVKIEGSVVMTNETENPVVIADGTIINEDQIFKPS